MNKLFISSTSSSNWEKQIATRIKIPYFDNYKPEECNIHYYYVDKHSTEPWPKEMLISANNKDKHTIFHINTKGLSYNYLMAINEVIDHMAEFGVHVFNTEDFTEPTNMVNSIARIPEYV